MSENKYGNLKKNVVLLANEHHSVQKKRFSYKFLLCSLSRKNDYVN